jgi:hypothetical protein
MTLPVMLMLYAQQHKSTGYGCAKYTGRKALQVQTYRQHTALQSPCFEVDPRSRQDLRRRTEIMPVKDSHTRIKPLALASSHSRYITVTPEWALVSVGEWPLHIAAINL